MYDTDRGIEELAARRGDDDVSLAWLAESMREVVDLCPGFGTPAAGPRSPPPDVGPRTPPWPGWPRACASSSTCFRSSRTRSTASRPGWLAGTTSTTTDPLAVAVGRTRVTRAGRDQPSRG